MNWLVNRQRTLGVVLIVVGASSICILLRPAAGGLVRAMSPALLLFGVMSAGLGVGGVFGRFGYGALLGLGAIGVLLCEFYRAAGHISR